MRNHSVILLFAIVHFACGSNPDEPYTPAEGDVEFVLQPDYGKFFSDLSHASHRSEFIAAARETEALESNGDPVATLYELYLEKGGSDEMWVRLFTTRNGDFTMADATSVEAVNTYLNTALETNLRKAREVLDRRYREVGIQAHIRVAIPVLRLYVPEEQQQVALRIASISGELSFDYTFDNFEVEQSFTALNDVIVNDSTLMRGITDSIDRKFPLFKIFNYSLEADVDGEGYLWTEGCTVGYCSFADTALMNVYLNLGYEQGLFMDDLLLMWGKEHNKSGYLPLHAIKREHNKPPLDGSYVDLARVSLDNMTQGPIVMLNFNQEGAEIWKEMTGKSINKAIAISFDGVVYSAPNVVGQISGGNTQITMGGASGEEARMQAEEMVQLLNAGALPLQFHIIPQ